MPALFKLLYFLFFIQGTLTEPFVWVKGIDMQTVSSPTHSILSIEAEPEVLKQAISICLFGDSSCQIKLEPINVNEQIGTEKVSITFTNLNDAVRNQIMERFAKMHGPLSLFWIND